MPRRHRARFVALSGLVAPGLIAAGRVVVDGRVVDNPAAMVRADASVRVMPEQTAAG